MQTSSEEKKGENEKRGNMFSVFSCFHSALTCGRLGKFTLVTNPGQKCDTRCEKSPQRRQTFLPPKDGGFYLALFNAGLLKENVIIKESNYKRKNQPVLIILIKYDYPVINICTGFTNIELRQNCRPPKYKEVYYTEPADTENDGMCRIQVGINRVLFGSDKSDNPTRYDGFPTTMWFDVYDPAIEQFLLMKFRARRLKSIFTRRRKHMKLIRPPTNSPLTIGDVMPQHNLIGPRFFEQQRDIRQQRVLIAVMTHRIGELGERQRMNRFNITLDPVLPFQNDFEREMNQVLSRRRRPLPSIHRSGSNTDQFEPDHRLNIPHNNRSNSPQNNQEEPSANNRLPLNRRLIF